MRYRTSSPIIFYIDQHPQVLVELIGAFIVLGLFFRGLHAIQDANTDNVSELEDRALKGDQDAALRVGLMFAKGDGVTRNYEQAVRWWRQAAEAGNSAAQFNLGRLLAKGQGCSPDPLEASRWYYAAAAQGDARAQCELGMLCDAGEGVEQDYAKAAGWYNQAAEQGNAKAQAHLAKLYYRGCGVEQNAAEAFVWVCLAAANNGKYAGLRDRLLAELTPEQKAAADERLAKIPRKIVSE